MPLFLRLFFFTDILWRQRSIDRLAPVTWFLKVLFIPIKSLTLYRMSLNIDGKRYLV